jgi:hypothetical protein
MQDVKLLEWINVEIVMRKREVGLPESFFGEIGLWESEIALCGKGLDYFEGGFWIEGPL